MERTMNSLVHLVDKTYSCTLRERAVHEDLVIFLMK
jgi:hypothetical protein